MGEYLDIEPTPQDALSDDLEVVSELSDGTRLMRTEDGGVVSPGPEGYSAYKFDHWEDARLVYGLWLRTGGYTTGESPTQQIPIDVVREGKDAVAAYLLAGAGIKNSRGFVASKLDVSEQTVSNYANRVRWSPEPA